MKGNCDRVVERRAKLALKGHVKSTAYAAQMVAQDASAPGNGSTGLKEVEVLVRGPGAGT
jgi:ribosomal protein S11